MIPATLPVNLSDRHLSFEGPSSSACTAAANRSHKRFARLPARYFVALAADQRCTNSAFLTSVSSVDASITDSNSGSNSDQPAVCRISDKRGSKRDAAIRGTTSTEIDESTGDHPAHITTRGPVSITCF